MVNGAGHIPEPAKAHLAPKVSRAVTQKVAFKPAPKVEIKGGHDEVTLSNKAKEVSSVASKVRQVPEVRPGKVEEIRHKIGNSGNAASQNAKIAEKLLTEH